MFVEKGGGGLNVEGRAKPDTIEIAGLRFELVHGGCRSLFVAALECKLDPECRRFSSFSPPEGSLRRWVLRFYSTVEECCTAPSYRPAPFPRWS